MAYDIDGEVPAHMELAHNRCEHGTYVGGCGIDHMCGWCESGIDQAERLDIEAAQRARTARRRMEDFDHMVGVLQDLQARTGWNAALAAALTDIAHQPHYLVAAEAL